MSNIPKDTKKVTDFIWEIPTSFKQGMNVPARIYASKKLLDAMDRGVIDQVTNVACLPGIQKYAFCMPDGHWGYGFPIGGVASFDVDTGVISPGGIGFDINCVVGDTKILCEYGYYKEIKEFEQELPLEKISYLDQENNQKKYAGIVFFLKKRSTGKVLRITTEYGEQIMLTKDHPLYTGEKMIEAGKLREGDCVVLHPFEGV